MAAVPSPPSSLASFLKSVNSELRRLTVHDYVYAKLLLPCVVRSEGVVHEVKRS